MRLRNKLGGLAVATLLAGFGLAATAASASAAPTPAASVKPLAAGVFNPIRNIGDGLHNGKCLQPVSTDETAQIVQMTCNGSLVQNWKFDQVGTNHFMIVNQLTGQCMNVFDGAKNGGRVLQTVCKRISNEEFNTGTALPAVTKIESRERFRDTGFCIDVPGGRLNDEGLAVQMFQCNGTAAQIWILGFA
jgi:Ricin-type beta-trefoil lectin domain-like